VPPRKLCVHRDAPFCLCPWILSVHRGASISVRHFKLCAQGAVFSCIPRKFAWTGNLFLLASLEIVRAKGCTILRAKVEIFRAVTQHFPFERENCACRGTGYFACNHRNCACTGNPFLASLKIGGCTGTQFCVRPW
jgi:hypothetical protein